MPRRKWRRSRPSRKTITCVTWPERSSPRRRTSFEPTPADITRAEEEGLSTPKLKRLGISAESLGQMAEGLRQVADLEDPVAQITRDRTLENGLRVKRVRCPLGVVMMIYESRPNVTIDAFSLCFKSGNACILKGGKEAQESNEALAAVIHATLREHDLPEEALVLVGSGGREAVAELLTFDDCIDLVIPRGGETLIRYVSDNSSIPTVQHFHGSVTCTSTSTPTSSAPWKFRSPARRPRRRPATPRGRARP